PEPERLPRAAAELRGPRTPWPEPVDHAAVRLHQGDAVDVAIARARPRHVDRLRVVGVQGRVDRNPRQRHLRVSGRARNPEVTDVLRIWVGRSSRPTVWVDRSIAVGVVQAEVKMRAGRGPGHTGDPDHLAPPHVLAPGDVDLREMAVVRKQPVAVIDLDGQPAEAAGT